MAPMLMAPLLIYLSLFLPVCMSTLVNITIDDEALNNLGNGSVSYFPRNDGVWSEGANCETCAFKPNANATYNLSWHDATYITDGRFPFPPTMTLLFPGDAIYVFCVVVNFAEVGVQTLTNLSFTLDGETSGIPYFHQPNGDPQYLYNQSVYNNTSLGSAASLANGLHNLTITVYGNILFDYAVYSIDNADIITPPSSNSTNTTSSSSTALASSNSGGPSGSASSAEASGTNVPPVIVHHSVDAGAIAGGVVGGLVGLTILAAIIFLILRRRSYSQHGYVEEPKEPSPGLIIEPFVLPSQSARRLPDIPIPPLSPPASSATTDDSPMSAAMLHGKLSPMSNESSAYLNSIDPPALSEPDTMRELQDRLRELQSRLDVLQDTRSQGSSRLEEEILLLREHVARLEAHRHSLWSAIDPPPEYNRREESSAS